MKERVQARDAGGNGRREARGSGMLCTHSCLPGMEESRGPLGGPDCKSVLQQQKSLLKLCGFVFWVVRIACGFPFSDQV